MAWSKIVSYSPTGKFLPNQFVFLFLMGLEESIGRNGYDALLQTSDPHGRCPTFPPNDLEKSVDFASFSALCEAVETQYGERGARNIVFLAARNAFAQTLQRVATLAVMRGPHFFTQAQAARIDQGLAAVARTLNLLSDMECESVIAEDFRRFRIFCCPECLNRSRPVDTCIGMAGLVRGALDWIGISSEIEVAETKCRGSGAPYCEFALSGIP